MAKFTLNLLLALMWLFLTGDFGIVTFIEGVVIGFGIIYLMEGVLGRSDYTKKATGYSNLSFSFYGNCLFPILKLQRSC
jgi:multicomponent Na+:H+ antiporter subunit E